jgi:hypothetical protein
MRIYGFCWAFLGLCLASQLANAQPMAAPVAAPEIGMSEAEQVKRFWADYYAALQRLYGSNGSHINPSYPTTGWSNPDNQRIQFVPIMINDPIMNWTGPTNNELNGPPANLTPMPIMPH